MSKAFVIKNKEGKYFTGFDISSAAHFDTYDICDCFIKPVLYKCDKYTFEEIQTAPTFKDCEVVEVTIAEGDLEQENELLKSIVKLDHPEIEKVKHFESGLMVILDKCVESKEQENIILKEALELACKNLFDYNNQKYNYFIEQAKESINGKRNEKV